MCCEIKDKLNDQFAQIGHAFSCSKRIELLDLLCQCPKRVEMLAENSGMSVANTSHHLQILRTAGLVETKRDGTSIFYRLADSQVAGLICLLKDVAASRSANVERIASALRDQPEHFAVVDRDQLLKYANSGEVFVLDVRPEDEFNAAHIPHAVSIPLERLESHLNALPPGQKIVAYCRGRYCMLANMAVKILRQNGFHAARLEEGFFEWRSAGLPVVSGSV
ncbi:ArsR family transcriptional regulator [candidate division KSB1 bacterium]|nr:MAG: ArsR family transcriptional regulator [candidate division KSB1 bacterium]